MEVEALEQMCNREFRMINGLYHPTDTILVKDEGIYISCQYRSTRYSIADIDEDSYKDTTRIDFTEFPSDREIRALIGFLAVHPQIRGRGFGKKMVEAVESIFRQRGLDKVDVENVENPKFWVKLGYTPRVVREREIEYKYYTKRLS